MSAWRSALRYTWYILYWWSFWRFRSFIYQSVYLKFWMKCIAPKSIKGFLPFIKSNPVFLINVFFCHVFYLYSYSLISSQINFAPYHHLVVLDFHHINYLIILAVTNTYWNYNCFRLLNNLNCLIQWNFVFPLFLLVCSFS